MVGILRPFIQKIRGGGLNEADPSSVLLGADVRSHAHRYAVHLKRPLRATCDGQMRGRWTGPACRTAWTLPDQHFGLRCTCPAFRAVARGARKTDEAKDPRSSTSPSFDLRGAVPGMGLIPPGPLPRSAPWASR